MLLANRWFIGTSLALAGVVGGWESSNAPATPATLNDANSTVRFDPASVSGEYDWVIDSVDVLTRQWFWYRIGNSGPATPIDQIDATPVIVTSDTLPNTGDNFLQLTYENATLKISLIYSLAGGQPGSGVADLHTVVTLNNINSNAEAPPLDVAVFQYSDFNLNDTPNNDTIEIIGPGNYNTARQYDDSTLVHETATSVTPDIYIADLIDGSNDLLPLLNDGSLTNFTPNIPGPVGPGDASWLFGWTASLAPGGTLQFGKDQSIVPEPATLALFASRKRAHA
ncbi:MAG: hypothetical protein WC058_16205 [Phycisphaeraceae bacterium]